MALISLIDLDQKRPNLALLKLSAYFKGHGDQVWFNFPLAVPDQAFASCVFPENAHRLENYPYADMVTCGGTGFTIDRQLAPEVEHQRPDYDLYPSMDYSLGFTSRGCPKRCPWCIVPAKEGGIQEWAEIKEFREPRFPKLMLLDNNLLAAPNCERVLEELASLQVQVDFNQGLDITYIDDDRAQLLSKVNLWRELRFSFDDVALEGAVKRGVDALSRAGIHPGRLLFYVLVGFDSTVSEDLHRFDLIASYGAAAFPMFYAPITLEGVEVVPARKPLGGGEKLPRTVKVRGPRPAISKYIRLLQPT